MAKECSFCKIIKGEIPSYRIYENKYIYVFAPTKETIIGKGHMLVIPKKHFKDIYDIDEIYLCELFKTIKYIAHKLKKRIKATGLNILHASGKSGQQSVFHFHIHLIPRFKGDGLDTWPKTNYKEKDFPKFYKKLDLILK